MFSHFLNERLRGRGRALRGRNFVQKIKINFKWKMYEIKYRNRI